MDPLNAFRLIDVVQATSVWLCLELEQLITRQKCHTLGCILPYVLTASVLCSQTSDPVWIANTLWLTVNRHSIRIEFLSVVHNYVRCFKRNELAPGFNCTSPSLNTIWNGPTHNRIVQNIPSQVYTYSAAEEILWFHGNQMFINMFTKARDCIRNYFS